MIWFFVNGIVAGKNEISIDANAFCKVYNEHAHGLITGLQIECIHQTGFYYADPSQLCLHWQYANTWLTGHIYKLSSCESRLVSNKTQGTTTAILEDQGMGKDVEPNLKNCQANVPSDYAPYMIAPANATCIKPKSISGASTALLDVASVLFAGAALL